VPDLAISLRDVSKAYPRYERPVDRLTAFFAPSRVRAQLFWALRSVTLDVPRGHTLGIVGRNGSGKSTLLQIVAQTLSPSTGTVRVNGRVSALLELGSGFNPDFTGRENIYFQGALLGFDRSQIDARVDEIAAFAEIGDFLDQPVRTYSSGMFIRLAFAVAISVDPDILIVDEALSVGDEAFQRKCFGRIRAIQEAGGTIVFVSHAAPTIVDLCDTAVLLDRGELLLAGAPKEVVARYHKLLFAPPEQQERLRVQYADLTRGGVSLDALPPVVDEPALVDPAPEYFDPALVSRTTLAYESRGTEILEPQLATTAGKSVNVLTRRREYLYSYRVRFDRPAFKVRFGMLIKSVSGFELGGAASHPQSGGFDHVEPGQVAQVRFRFRCLLRPATYFLNAGVVGVIDGEEVFLHRYIDVLAFRVLPDAGDVSTGVVDFLVEPEAEFVAEVRLQET
jgi:lipopolysaccharide transport system ATP-binding protein